MFFDAVRAAFQRFPVDPPGPLNPGDIVRIGWGGKLLHLNSLASLLKTRLEEDIAEAEIEFMSNGLRKAKAGVNATEGAEATIGFSNAPGIYIRGRRRVRRLKNIDIILSKIVKKKLGWSLRRRIVVETHEVNDADIICSSSASSDIKVRYDAAGTPVAVDGNYARQQQGVLYLPKVTGTIAFGAIFMLPWGFGASDQSIRWGHLDPNDLQNFEESFDDE